jgi:uncharacterized repeat protein (TIGR01451 family)
MQWMAARGGTNDCPTVAGLLAGLLLFWGQVLPPQAIAQPPVVPTPGLPPTAAPLLYVRLVGPAGMTVTCYRGAAAETRPAPLVLGLRPGYVQHLRLSGFPSFPDISFYPTLEVNGSLLLDSGVNPADYPATLEVTEDDCRAASRGELLVKVLLLERPERALPQAAPPGRALTLRVPAGRDPRAEARAYGRVLLIFRLGGRTWQEEELAARAVPQTLLLPGEKGLGIPPWPPQLPWACFPLFYDPRHGPASGQEEVCVPDGGDGGLPAGYDEEGHLRGLDPADTLAEYQDSLGQRRIVASNRICLCVPRFLVLVSAQQPAAQQALRRAEERRGSLQEDAVQQEQMLAQEQRQELAGELRSRAGASGIERLQGPVIVGQLDGLAVTGAVRLADSVSAACEPPPAAPADRPLLLIKWPDKCTALAGDLITFTLRYTNQGGRPISHIVISDSLAARYEYIPGSAHSDRPATFTTQANEAGSLILRWYIRQPLPPGESGTLRFQVRIR